MDYKAAGVDIDAGNETVRRIRGLARSTFTSGVLSDIGSFGGLFQLESGRFREPVLVASADGVGTKLKIAFMTGQHDTVGADLVNHCVNDILVQGAEPLFFLDYLATGRLSPAVAEQCRWRHCVQRAATTTARCSAARPRKCRGSTPTANTTSPASSSVSSIASGLSTVVTILVVTCSSAFRRRACIPMAFRLPASIVFERLGLTVDTARAGARSHGRRGAAGAASLVPAIVRPLLDGGRIKGMAHITGGGITDNLPRVLPAWDVGGRRRRRVGGPAAFQLASAERSGAD